MRQKFIQLPNGRRIASNEIRDVNVFPERSVSRMLVYMQVFDATGLVYEGLLDLAKARTTVLDAVA